MDYLELTIAVTPRNPWSDILTAQLAEVGFDSFVETESGILAYAPANSIDLSDVGIRSILSSENKECRIEFQSTILPHQNWNEQWESDFQPVEVEDYLTIVAPFHSKDDKKGMVVEIQPQMSFGTGHHQTTWLMSKALFELNKMPETVLDMGTGTGVLAIIAEKLGASSVVGIDIEDWTVMNAKENVDRNNCGNIRVFCGDVDLIEGEKFDLIIANINKNVLKAHLPMYSKSLVTGGILLLSGFFESDVNELVTFSEKLGLKEDKVYLKETWAGIQLHKI